MSVFTQEDLEKVKDLAQQIGGDTLFKYGGHPFAGLFALATLAMAASQVAVITGTTYAQLMELVTMHYRAAEMGVIIQELEEQLGVPVPAKLSEPS